MRLQRFLWIIAGAEPSILRNCKTDYKKFSSIGATILMTSFIAFCAGTCAAWYFTQSGDDMNGSIGWSVLFGLIWSLLIFCIDRSLVITLKKDPTKRHQKFWIPFLSRAVLACIIAFMVSIPLELFIFKDYINENIENFKQKKVGQLGRTIKVYSGEDELNDRITIATKNLGKYFDFSKKMSNSIDSLQKRVGELEYEKDYPKSTEYSIAQRKHSLAQQYCDEAKQKLEKEQNKEYSSQSVINELKKAVEKYEKQKRMAQNEMVKAKKIWKKNIQKQIDQVNVVKLQKKAEKQNTDSIHNQIAAGRKIDLASVQEADSIRKQSEQIKKAQMEKGNRFILNFQILDFAVKQRDENGNFTDLTQLCFLWLIRLLFFIIEILPTMVKIVTPVGAYDQVVYAQEKSMESYLNSSEFIDSMREIHQSELKAQLEETKLRQEAELQMKKDILRRVTSVQIEVANIAINNWKTEELRKFSEQPPSNNTTTPPLTSTDTVNDNLNNLDSKNIK